MIETRDQICRVQYIQVKWSVVGIKNFEKEKTQKRHVPESQSKNIL